MSKATTLDGTTQHRHADVEQARVGFESDAMPLVRELDHRRSDGIDVRLVWDTRSEEVAIALTDERFDEALTFVVEPSEALSAFHHPYAYAARSSRPRHTGRRS